jgi:hypothetical protein
MRRSPLLLSSDSPKGFHVLMQDFSPPDVLIRRCGPQGDLHLNGFAVAIVH